MDTNPELLVAMEMKEDGPLFRDDAFAVFLDTFHDRRNGFFFETNPLGARTDALIYDEGRNNSFDWDGIWEVATQVKEAADTIARRARVIIAAAQEPGFNMERLRKAWGDAAEIH